MNIENKLLARNSSIFDADLLDNLKYFTEEISNSSFLVIGAAGSIGASVSTELFKKNPSKLHLVDISENNMVELVRGLRSTIGYSSGEFKPIILDVGSDEFKKFVDIEGPYDYILNLSAMKHVRSENDPFSLIRLIEINIMNPLSILNVLNNSKFKKYFCVSTDKASNPINMMGASKRIMEISLMNQMDHNPISTARFANVAFSDGSLLHGFEERIKRNQPLSVPSDISRYFVTHNEASELCLFSCLKGNSGEIFFPKLSEKLSEVSFKSLAIDYLKIKGFKPLFCNSEQEAREEVKSISRGYWPLYIFKSDTTGEKELESFYDDKDEIDMNTFKSMGIIKFKKMFSQNKILDFMSSFSSIKKSSRRDKKELIDLFSSFLGEEFVYLDRGKNLHDKM